MKFHSRFFQSIFAGSIDQTREKRERENLRVFREREREVDCAVKKTLKSVNVTVMSYVM